MVALRPFRPRTRGRFPDPPARSPFQTCRWTRHDSSRREAFYLLSDSIFSLHSAFAMVILLA